MEKGSIVICDRFWDSTIAYQGYGRQIPIDFIEKCNFFASEGLEPDITFLLDIDIEIMKRRAKTNIFDRIESEGIEFLKRVANGFRVLAKQYNERIFVIDGSNTIEDIHKKVVEIIENRLKGRDE